MGYVSLIEPVVGLHAFSMFMTYPLLQQYIYRRLWQQLSGHPYPSNQNQSHCSSNYTNLSLQQAVQTETSHFLLQSELCFILPSLFTSPLLVSYSDYGGRKSAMVPPLLGDLFFTFHYFIVSRFSLNLSYVLAAAFLTGLLGGPTTLIGGCFSYVADYCREELAGQKTVRMARLDMVLGVLSGLGSLCTGFFIRAAGFSWPFLCASILHLLNLMYVLIILKEPPGQNLPPSPSSPGYVIEPPRLSQAQAMTGRLQGVYLLFAASTRRRRTVLLLLLTAYIFYKVSNMGGMSIFILYELNAPLCWNEVLVSYGSALSTLIYLSSFTGVALLSRWLPDAPIALLGLLSIAVGLSMAAFAKTTLLMFLVRLPLLLSMMPAPVMRAMMSKLALSSEQGALFACVAFVEMLSMGLAFPVFSSVYAATISWFSGFSFLLAAGVTLIPITLIGCVLWLRLDVEESSILASEDNSEEDNTNSEIF
ncbi:solute carrier family 46 member 3 [Astyanax mexicanus]|uniref:solute carrier family 46 member 3 n=1 Tax=Astyanax mexicanus TaxID=7994 RepID=UPI0020CAC68A|nr:solute carrier family 46 member 3 [Astyanax mexicanus]XP_049324974.1 solute carrier family 46 member 3 [Astyanax mexicanus]